MFSQLYDLKKKGQFSPVVLSDKYSSAGKGRRLCLVSDGTVLGPPTAHQSALWFVKDGWDVTLLDVAQYAEIVGQKNIDFSQDALDQTKTHNYKYVHLKGTYQEQNWFLPMISLSCYHWLKNEAFDLVVFQHNFGAGYFCCVSKQMGLSFKTTPLIALVDNPYARWLEDAEYFPSFIRTDAEIDFFERETVARVDGVFSTDAKCMEWMNAVHWRVSRGEQRYAVLGEDEGRPWGEWLASYIGNCDQKPLLNSEDIRISICIASYNRPELLRDTIRSLLVQTYKNFEVIVVDDGSSDPGVEVLREEMAATFIERGWIWERQSNQGQSRARNRGAELATGTHLFFKDDDNYAMPDEVEIFALAAQSGADILTVVVGKHYLSDNAAGAIARFPTRPACKDIDVTVHWVFYGACLAINTMLDCAGDLNCMYRREVFDELGGFKSKRGEVFEDWELLVQGMLKGYRLETIPEITVFYRSYADNAHIQSSKSFNGHMKIMRAYAKVIPEYLHPILLAVRAPFVNWDRKNPGRYPDPARSILGGYGHDTRHRLFRRNKLKDRPQVALCVTEEFIRTACVTIASLATSCADDLDIYVISTLSEEKNALFEAIARHFVSSIKIIPFQSNDDSRMPPSYGLDRRPQGTYWLPLIGEYLPQLKRVLVINSDRMVRSSIKDLWGVELGGNILAAVPDVILGHRAHFKHNYTSYFNSDVMLIDLEAWRRGDIGNRVFDIIKSYEKRRDINQIWATSALNDAISERWLSISPTWNFLDFKIVTPSQKILTDVHAFFKLQKDVYEAINHNPAIVYFSDVTKPYKEGSEENHFTHEYCVYLKQIDNLTKRITQETKELSDYVSNVVSNSDAIEEKSFITKSKNKVRIRQ